MKNVSITVHLFIQPETSGRKILQSNYSKNMNLTSEKKDEPGIKISPRRLHVLECDKLRCVPYFLAIKTSRLSCSTGVSVVVTDNSV
jgi:hypothetical protein